MKLAINVRLTALLLASSLAPVAVFAACLPGPGGEHLYALSLAATTALAAVLLAAAGIMRGFASPVCGVASMLKCFTAPAYRLEAAVAKEGWPEAQGIIGDVNRLMLELSAYRAFNVDQVLEERGRAQALIEAVPDGIILLDDRGLVVYSNRAALRLLGITDPGKTTVLPEAVRNAAFFDVFRAITASQEVFVKAEAAVPGEEGACVAARNFRITSRQFRLATIKQPGRVIVMRDITVEKEIENARETVFHMITHDMRAPLSSIQGYTQLLGKEILPFPEGAKYLEVIMRSSKRLNGMIEDILNTIKLEHGTMELRRGIVAAAELCARVFELHEPLAARKNIRFSITPLPAGVAFPGDAALLERVITNLVGNSLKFTPQGGEVSLSCREAAGEVVFYVEDTGPGIPDDKKKEIFEKYAQLDEHKYMGFGLGLAMCRMAVELHKGRIWVESELGKGSRFFFAVPSCGMETVRPLRAGSGLQG